VNGATDLSGRLRGLLAGDLVLVVAVVVSTDLLFVLGVDRPLIRIVTGAPFVLLCPGYAFVAALFPESPPASVGDVPPRIDGSERLLLAVGTSVVLSPLLGLALSYTPVGLAPSAVVATVSTFTLTLTLIAAWRRSRLVPGRRFTLVTGRARPLRAALAGQSGSLGTAAAVVVLLALVTAVGGVSWAAYERPPGETLTEFYVLPGNESGKVMNGYPDRLAPGDTTVRVGIANEEHRAVTYTVVTSLQEVRRDDGSVVVVASQELDRIRTPPLRDGEEWVAPVSVSPSNNGESDGLRLTFSLYVGSAPANPGVKGAHRRTYIWVNSGPP